MPRKIRIWTLNQATTLIQGKEEEIIDLFEQQGIECAFGNRPRPYDDGTPSHQLMYEPKSKPQTEAESNQQHMVDEYFVPIPLKCIGKRYRQQDRESLPESGREILDAIVNHYSTRRDAQGQEKPSYFNEQEDSVFQAFWTLNDSDVLRRTDQTVSAAFGRVRMATEDFQGYYDILDSEKYRGEQHVLIGYSQGGLVARYLAFLDEYVFQKNIIAGVITIAAPNYGSPLANRANKDYIASGVIRIAQTAQQSTMVVPRIRSIEPMVGVILDTLSALDPESENYDELYRLITTAYQAKVDELDPTEIEEDTLVSLLKTAIKWLSGIQDDPFSAFDELDIQNYDKPYSVLNLINHRQYRSQSIYSGSIITGNNMTTGLIASFLASLHPSLARLSGLIQAGLRGVLGIFSGLRGRIRRYNEIYQGEIMKEYGENIPDSSIKTALTQNYQNEYPKGQGAEQLGPQQLSIPRQAHDFVIPSVYQILPDTGDRLLGHRINLRANHNSGKDIKSRPGRQNWQYTRELLTRLAQTLD